jgi:hypothetical protein
MLTAAVVLVSLLSINAYTVAAIVLVAMVLSIYMSLSFVYWSRIVNGTSTDGWTLCNSANGQTDAQVIFSPWDFGSESTNATHVLHGFMLATILSSVVLLAYTMSKQETQKGKVYTGAALGLTLSGTLLSAVLYHMY